METKKKNQARKIAKNMKQEEKIYYVFGLEDTYENSEYATPTRFQKLVSRFSSFFAAKIMPYINLFSFL